ncbi:MAG: YbjQ family protein [Methanomassiliicoccaceae archaeon]|nr:YbjQ family protein [Methanomassiliicoccaceae archaeon]
MLVSTNYIAGKELEMLGLVKGSMVQTKHIGKDIVQGFKSMVGGELKAYTEMMNDSRTQATNRMITEAEALQADAIVNVRFSTSSIVQGAAEVIAYGTAVRFV